MQAGPESQDDAGATPVLEKVTLAAVADTLEGPWRPALLATPNGQELKLARLEGAFVWHRHVDVDEAFLCVEGRFRLETRGPKGQVAAVELGPGELAVVPRGVEHRPVAEDPALTLIFEPAGVRNTGDVEDPIYTAPPAGGSDARA